MEDGEPSDLQYEVMKTGKHTYLCAVPKVTKVKVPKSSNADVLQIEQAEKQELERAAQRGWELLKPLEGTCLFYGEGWWTYSFCYNDEIKQFHRLMPQQGMPWGPPVEDPNVESYYLGKFSDLGAEHDGTGSAKSTELANFRHVGDSRSLVVNYGMGSYCDVIGAERRTEVQFQCNPGTSDRIAFIKETSSCHYLLVVHTPRLCHDAAFQAPVTEQPHLIQCEKVSDGHGLPEIEGAQSKEEVHIQQEILESQSIELKEELVVPDEPDLSHLSFDPIPTDLPDVIPESNRREAIPKEKQQKQRAAMKQSDKYIAVIPGLDTKQQRDKAAEILADVIEQDIADGLFEFDGRKIGPRDNFQDQVELIDEQGVSLGVVGLVIRNGLVTFEMSDILDDSRKKQTLQKQQKQQEVAKSKLPETIRKALGDFVGRDEL